MRRTRHYLTGRSTWMVSATLGSLLVMLMVAACGSNTSTGGQGGQEGQPGPTATTPLQTQNCGSLHSNLTGLIQSDKAGAMQVENCFFNAYKQCHPATLTYQTVSVDTEVVNHLAVKNKNGSCALTDAVQHSIAPHPLGRAITYSCTSASIETDGLHIASCGDVGDVVIPLK